MNHGLGGAVCYATYSTPQQQRWIQQRVTTPRKTNVFRPVYRLGWLVIWSSWLALVLLVVPAVVSRHNLFHRLVLYVLVSIVAYFVYRLWEYVITGRLLPRWSRRG
ncbi:MAG TPA: hypothetical protein DDZ73_15920 [Gammaproteobacteria bacterium]|nr:MAG: hypothetical protein COA89_02695 [Acidithiobacillus sp.]RTZ66722.1 MAG: hypothetical protein DSZ34_00360 [Gammaproteobacteria bacterium]HAD38097.1 hypothetical protein [Gammaproteobacteria bacterium]HBK77833.1 hypothetical protein [Gammaproteobacteria bacterium]